MEERERLEVPGMMGQEQIDTEWSLGTHYYTVLLKGR